MVGTRRFIAQSFSGWWFAREGGPIKTEEDPIDPSAPTSFSKTLAAIRYLEYTVHEAQDEEDSPNSWSYPKDVQSVA
jgi:hypothetical protein